MRRPGLPRPAARALESPFGDASAADLLKEETWAHYNGVVLLLLRAELQPDERLERQAALMCVP